MRATNTTVNEWREYEATVNNKRKTSDFNCKMREVKQGFERTSQKLRCLERTSNNNIHPRIGDPVSNFLLGPGAWKAPKPDIHHPSIHLLSLEAWLLFCWLLYRYKLVCANWNLSAASWAVQMTFLIIRHFRQLLPVNATQPLVQGP